MQYRLPVIPYKAYKLFSFYLFTTFRVITVNDFRLAQTYNNFSFFLLKKILLVFRG